MRFLWPAMTAACLGLPPAAGAGVAEAVSSVRDGEIRMTYDARDGVWGDGHNLTMGGDGVRWFREGMGERRLANGPVRARITRHRGEVVEVEVTVGGHPRGAGGDVTDLGLVDPTEAAALLLEIARGTSRSSVAEEALCGAVIARGAVVWPELLALAQDDGVHPATRGRAVFWLAQEAGEAVLRGHEDLDRDDPDLEVREQAVFAVSQRRRSESLPVLMNIAKNHSDPRIRKQAIFWLGQEPDPRAVELFATILREE